jgi:hypothetical protein
MKEKLEKFIKGHGLTFTVGKRNSDCTTISGYALSLGITNCHQLENIIDQILPDAEKISGYKEELRRVFPYAKNHNYQNYWLKK